MRTIELNKVHAQYICALEFNIYIYGEHIDSSKLYDYNVCLLKILINRVHADDMIFTKRCKHYIRILKLKYCGACHISLLHFIQYYINIILMN